MADESTEGGAIPLLKHLKRYVLRSKIKLRDVTEEYDTWSVLDSSSGQQRDQGKDAWHGPTKRWKMGSGGAAEVTWDMGEESVGHLGLENEQVGSWDLRAGWGQGSMGKRLLVRKGDRRKFFSNLLYLRVSFEERGEFSCGMIPGVDRELEYYTDIRPCHVIEQ